MSKLTPGQSAILAYLGKRNRDRDGCPDATEISHMLGHRARYWADGKLRSLLGKGFVETVGSSPSNARTWAITEPGRRASIEQSR